MSKKGYLVITDKLYPGESVREDPTEEEWDQTTEQIEYSMESAIEAAIREDWWEIDDEDQFVVWARCIETEDQPVVKQLVVASHSIEFRHRALD